MTTIDTPTPPITRGSPQQKVIVETKRRRDEASRLLSSLLEAKQVSESNLAMLHQDDLMKRVSGRSSMDNAIASTRRLIDSFNRILDDLRRNLSDEDLRFLESLEAPNA